MRAALVLVVFASVAAAEPRTVRGVVTEADSLLPVAGASILTDRGDIVVTDVDGFFTIDVPEGESLTVAATGYATTTLAVGDSSLARVQLARASGAEVIEVIDRAPEETKPISYELTIDEIRSIPGAANDVLRAAQVLPGVARLPFSFGGLVLRGTSPRDTSVYLDGVEVPLAFHFGGVTSFYPSMLLSDMNVTASGFDASYGRAQGGLVTLTTREPRTDRWRVGGAIGLFDSAVYTEGPLWNGGVIVGVRRSYLDAVVDPFLADDTPLPSYWDFQIRTSFGDPRKRGRITPMVFGAIDRMTSTNATATSMFVRAAVPYTRQWGPTTLRLVPWVGTNRLSFEQVTEPDPLDPSQMETTTRFERPVYPAGVRGDLVRDFSWGHLRGGAEVTSSYLAKSQTDAALLEGGATTYSGDTTLMWTDAAAYTELRWKLDGDRFAIKPGLRVDIYGISNEVVVDPRLNMHQKANDNVTFRQSLGRYHQPPTPGDTDPMAGNRDLDSSYMDHFSVGADITSGNTTASITSFVGFGNNLGVEVLRPEEVGQWQLRPNAGGLGPTFQLLLDKQLGFAIYRENIGRARTAGVELSLKRNTERWFTLLSYTLARSDRNDDPNAYMGWRPFELDQRHNVQLAVSLKLEKWRFGARLQAVSGNPYSPTDEYTGEPDLWAGNLPTYFSFDVRADRRWHRSWGDVVLFVDVQNATNRRNVEAREPDPSFPNYDRDVPGLPILPFIGVEVQPPP